MMFLCDNKSTLLVNEEGLDLLNETNNERPSASTFYQQASSLPV